MNEEKTENTPLMRQYWQIKDQYKHAILFFRLGDFYEMFGEDAKKAAKILGLVLTKRGDTPMCGIPYHSALGYIAKLLKAGYKTAICEQTTLPSAKTKLVERKVIRVITPGTVLTDELLDAKNANHLAVIEADLVGWGLACIDVSTGEFWAVQIIGDGNLTELAALLARISPSETVASEFVSNKLISAGLLSRQSNVTNFDLEIEKLAAPPHWPLDERWRNYPLALKAALKAEKYVTGNEPSLEGSLKPVLTEINNVLNMDENAIRSLELVECAEGGRKHTLWGTLDKTQTAMGSRMLRNWILNPLIDIPKIKKRQSQVNELVASGENRDALAALLKDMSDIERVLSRSMANSTTPPDIIGLKRSLSYLEDLDKWLKNSAGAFHNTALTFGDISPSLLQLSVLLDKAVDENAPSKLGEGKFIKPGYNAELDGLRNVRENSGGKLQELCEREKAKTGISSLKIGYNSVFGYFIDITNSNLSKVPPDYIRKQTLTNSERFITEELKNLESAILGADERINTLELHLFNELKNEITGRSSQIKTFASLIAELDVFYSLAETAVQNNYVMPEVDLSFELEFVNAKHPVASLNLPPGTFVPNDTLIGTPNCRIMIITGPNMSGKSVYLKQNALLVIMAQIGSFVPAQKARVGLVDRIMTRIGAHDALAKGQSTFMVEMKETANILNSLTPRSFVLLDEVGRGTSTFDGISIAWAVVEYLASCEQKPRIMFATHYFELTELPSKYEGIQNFNIEVKEWENKRGKTELTFMYKIAQGPADKSYGIHVAEIAGLPAACTIRAKKILTSLEDKSEYPVAGVPSEAKLPMFGGAAIIDEIRLTNPDKMTPLESSMLIAQWKKRIENEH